MNFDVKRHYEQNILRSHFF